jgi:hypothetical protein
MTIHSFRASLAVLWIAIGVALGGCASTWVEPDVAAALAAAPEQTQPIEKGQKYVMATHSFNGFIGPARSRDALVDPMQQTAWNAVVSEPMSGVRGPMLKVD